MCRLVCSLIATLLCAALLSGCGSRPGDSGEVRRAKDGGNLPRAVDSTRLDASPRETQLLALRVFVLEIPRGQVSSNRELWRRIDEQSVDPGTYDVLWSNGIRVGGAAVSEMEHISDLLGIESTQRMDLLARDVGRQVTELPLRPEIGETTIFWFDAAKRHHGRTFQRCETAMMLAFEPTPGRTQSVRITMTPVVRARDARTVVTPQGDDYAVTQEKETTLFDLRLKADVPIGEFLIIAPSDELMWEMCVGRQFFTSEHDGELWERVYVLVPHIARSTQVRR